MALYRGYEPARRCTGSATPGAKALQAWFLGAYRHLGAVNSGIYNCREVRGGGSWSLHAEGRAGDLGIRPHRARYGTELAEWLRLHSAELGVQLIIWNRRVWSGSRPDAGWRPYSGVNAHVDHIHVELSWHAARTLTVARIEAVRRGAPAPTGGEGRETLRPGSTGDAVRRLQEAMALKVDGHYGPATEAKVREFQKLRGLAADGIYGPATRAALEDDMPVTDADVNKIAGAAAALVWKWTLKGEKPYTPEDHAWRMIRETRDLVKATEAQQKQRDERIIGLLEQILAALPKAG